MCPEGWQRFCHALKLLSCSAFCEGLYSGTLSSHMISCNGWHAGPSDVQLHHKQVPLVLMWACDLYKNYVPSVLCKWVGFGRLLYQRHGKAGGCERVKAFINKTWRRFKKRRVKTITRSLTISEEILRLSLLALACFPMNCMDVVISNLSWEAPRSTAVYKS